MSFALTRDVYCHDIVNPPAKDRRSDINVELVGSNLISLTRNPLLDELHSDMTFETPYSIEISNPNLVGFSSDDTNIVTMEFRNLLLSFNLLLHRVCFADRSTYFSHPIIIPNLPQSTSHVVKVDNKYAARLEDSIIIRDYASVTIGTRDSIEENAIVQLFKKLQEFKGFELSSNSTIWRANLSRSLLEYEEAMSSMQVLTKFKHLFNSLEYSVNIDGKDRVGAEFDGYVCNLIKLRPLRDTEVKGWRDIHNRNKHIERNPADLEKYLEGSKKIVSYILPIREAVCELLLGKLT